ncbi:mitotic checkpoint serine/threonine-protein kinase BUB1 isoform X2 [Nilaparvata lugens]|uniref:mitotic checkpoint serine/threonine-protein kinase BUB1 isoform X2 n=1 Tax=Nilaparvata lugens TaxID=108931 RepID=UPI00193CB4FF|nr:mitotic checkpoint serine/threonine-protein kinase BUB1 isoform X2 [Nilaparvata lugens]
MEAPDLKEREFAQQLKQCTGNEELDVILNYINWLEVNCPQKAVDGEVMKILSNTLTKFNETQYTNDTRYIGLLVKYMQVQPNAVELFQLAFNQGKGVECAVLYCAWANHLARIKNVRGANQIYQLGSEKNAKPTEQLQLAYLLFQMNVGRNFLGMSELEAFGSDVIDAFMTVYPPPQRLPQPQQNCSMQPKMDDQEWPVAVFDPENPSVLCCYPKKEIYNIKNHEFQYEEILALRHERKLQNPAVKEQNGAASIPACKKDDEELKCAVALFEPDNPRVVKCYPFKEVYAIENNEFQLEEVYAARYEKKLQEKMKTNLKEKRKTLLPNELADLTRNSFMIQDAEQQEAIKTKAAGKQAMLLQPSKLEKHGNDSASNEWSRNSQNADVTPHSMGSAPSGGFANQSHMNQSVTREVMNMVQDMWKSPSPVAAKMQPPPAMASIRKSSVHPTTATKTPFKLYTDQMDVDGTPANANKENPLCAPGQENKENPFCPPGQESAARRSLHPTTKTPFKLYTDQMDVDGTPQAKADSQPPVKQAFPSARFQRNQFVANDWTKNPQMDENAQSMASAVRPSCENQGASNMNQSVTREVMNIIQDMWKDSTPSPVKGKQAVSTAKAGSIPIYTDDDCDAATTAKRQPQPQAAAAGRNPPLAVNSRKSLLFDQQLKENHCPPQNFRVPAPRQGLRIGQDEVEMLPDSDFADTTCNTRAFQLALPSSTPLITHTMRGNPHAHALSMANRDSNNCSILLADGSQKPNTDLSIIMEASKEKYSSSSGSSSGVRTPYTINKLHHAEDIKEETEESQLEKLVSQITIDDNFDPFCPNFVANLLSSINFPQNHHAAHMVGIDRDVPLLPHNATVTLGNKEYRIESELGEGSYARVLRATTNKKIVGLKLQKPAFAWEYYIAKEIQTRLKSSPILKGFMSIDCAYMFRNASILEMDFAPFGNLLDAINKVKAASGKQIHVSIATLLSIQLFDIVDHLHKCRIIHGDVKPDNFVLFSIPSSDPHNICIKLIDFGRSIDMSLLPDGVEFRRVVKTEDFQCTEMRDGKPWTYQTDLFGLAGTTYLLLMGEYMKVTKRGNEWVLQKNLHRYLHREVWLPIYEELLNVESCSKLPNLSELRKKLQNLLVSMDQKWLSHCLMSFGNILQGR